MNLSRKVKGVPVWVVAALLVCLVLSSVAAYIFATVKFSVNVKEPLSVVASPSLLSLYPNMTEGFNVTVSNAAAVNYLVSLAFSLNDTAYQQSYVTFSNETYVVEPGQNNLTAYITVAPDAPPTQLEVTVDVTRGSMEQPTFGYTFTWSNETQSFVNGTLTLEMNFTKIQDKMLIVTQINDTYDYNSSNLGIMFDLNFDGEFDDGGYIFWYNNVTWKGSYDYIQKTQWGEVVWAVQMRPENHTYHYATFNKEKGWTYYVTIPLSELPDKDRNCDGLIVHVCYVSRGWRPTRWGHNVIFTDFLYDIWWP